MKKQRPLGPTLFATLIFAAIAAGCAGGMKGTLPASPAAGISSEDAARKKRVGATLRIVIPPAPRRHRRGSKYVSPSTQSITVLVQSVTSTKPWPSLPLQTLVVATPKPCVEATGGVRTCTFAVHAYVGKNVFTFNQYASKNPSPQDTPLATLSSGITDVVAGKSLPPFVMRGVVTSVLLNVPSPEDMHDPVAANTEAVPIGAPSSFLLGVSPLDPAGNRIATDTFSAPTGITVSVSNTNSGVKLALDKQCKNDVATPATVTMHCADDLTHLSVVYDGTITKAGALAYVDSAQITASPQGTAPTPVPATVALTSNAVSYQLVPATGGTATPIDLSNIALDKATGKFVFEADYNYTSPMLVEFDPASPTGVATAPIGFLADTVFVDSQGHIWTNEDSDSYLHCFASLSATPSNIATSNTSADLYDSAIAQDGSGNIWYAGQDEDYYPSAGFISDNCNAGNAVAQFMFGYYSEYPYAIALAKPSPDPGIWIPAGGVAQPYLYTMHTTTATNPTPSPVAAWTPGEFPDGLVNDPSYNLYTGTREPSGTSVINKVAAGSTTLQTLLTLMPDSQAYGISEFSGSQTTAQALLVTDYGYGAAALLSPVSATTEPLEMVAPDSFYECPTAFDANGGVWTVCGRTDGSIWATHSIVTSNWGVVAPSDMYQESTFYNLATMAERGTSSAPFTVVANSNPSVVVTETPFPGFPHGIPIASNATGTSTLTIQDKNGRQQQFTINVGPSNVTSGRHHRARVRPRRRP